MDGLLRCKLVFDYAIQVEKRQNAHITGAVDEYTLAFLGVHHGEELFYVLDGWGVLRYRDRNVCHAGIFDQSALFGKRVGEGVQVDHHIEAGPSNGGELIFTRLACCPNPIREAEKIRNGFER